MIGGISAAIDAVVTWLQRAAQPARLPAPGAGDRLARRGRAADLAGLRARRAGGPRCWCSSACSLFGFLGYWADSIDTLIVTARRGRASAWSSACRSAIWMAAQHAGDGGAHARPRLHADDADVRLPGAAGAVLRHRPGLGRDRHPDLRAAAADPDHRARHPDRVADDRRGRRLARRHRRQALRKVQLPMAKRTIVVGINQTIMAALSMATIAALIDGPGLGKPVVQALQTLDVGTAFIGGLAIVIMAIVLDRTTTAASERAEVADPQAATAPRGRGAGRPRGRRGGRRSVAVYLSRTYLRAGRVPRRGPTSAAPLAAGGHQRHRLAGQRHRRRRHRRRSRTWSPTALLNPLAVAAGGLAVVADGPGPARLRLPARRLAADGHRGGLPAA